MSKKKKEIKPQEPKINGFGVTNEQLLDDFLEYEDIEILDDHNNGYESEEDADHDDGFEAMLYLFKYHGKYGVVRMPGWDYYAEELDFLCFETEEEARMKFESMKEVGIKPFKERITDCKEAVGRTDFYIKVKSYYCGVTYQIFQDRNILLDNLRSLDSELIRETLERYQELKNILSENEFTLDSIEKYRPWNDNQRYFIFRLRDEHWEDVTFEQHIPSKIQGRLRCSLDFFPMDEFKAMSSPEGKRKRAEEKAEKEKQAQLWREERDDYLQNHRILTFAQIRDLCEHINIHTCDGTMRQTKSWIKKNMPGKTKDILKELEYMGGYCDCEVVLNCLREAEELEKK